MENDDPLLQWTRSISKALDNLDSEENSYEELDELVSTCIRTFRNDIRYQDDPRFLKIWFLYIDSGADSDSVFREMESFKICLYQSVLYEGYAIYLEAMGRIHDANSIYQLGISRNAKPVERLKKAHALFIERMRDVLKDCSLNRDDPNAILEDGEKYINPWAITTIKELLQKINTQMLKYKGYHASTKPYPGKVSLSSLQKAKKRVIDIGGKKYQIIGCAGQGGFAQIFKAYIDSNPDEVVALKIQKPPFPWEFYMYRQLDLRIQEKERMSFGFAHRLHLYSDYSILVSDYLSHGTLQDAINSYNVIGEFMEEIMCIYYTIEMLYMLETLHTAGIIHGDFKPDNLLTRYARNDLTEDGLLDRTGPWRDQGLCLVDWGRGIDRNLFPDITKFNGDCRTSGFRCIEMQEKKPWTFQVDTYGLCVVVHLMLHNTYMEIEKKPSSDNENGFIYQPKSPLKRYWKVDLWKNLFTKLLNCNDNEDHILILKNLRLSFEEYLHSNPQLIKRLKQLLVKQKTSLCTS